MYNTHLCFQEWSPWVPCHSHVFLGQHQVFWRSKAKIAKPDFFLSSLHFLMWKQLTTTLNTKIIYSHFSDELFWKQSWLLHSFITWETCKESYFHRHSHGLGRMLAWISSLSYIWHCSWSCKLTPLSIIFQSNHLWSKNLWVRCLLEWISDSKMTIPTSPLPNAHRSTQSCG